jgi:hypothetical protein
MRSGAHARVPWDAVVRRALHRPSKSLYGGIKTSKIAVVLI